MELGWVILGLKRPQEDPQPAVTLVVTCVKGTVASYPKACWEKYTFLALWRKMARTLHAVDGSTKQFMMQYFAKISKYVRNPQEKSDIPYISGNVFVSWKSWRKPKHAV